MAASVMNYPGSSLRLTGGITKSRTKTISRLEVANPKKLKNVRKMLFGPVDRDETRRIVETQLTKHVLDATSRWGFDFTSDQPIRSPEAKYVWERVPPLNSAERPLMTSSSCSPVPVITLSSAAHVRTIDTVTLSPSPSLSSANSSLLSSPSTSMCNSDLETDVDMVGGDLNGVESNSSSQVAKRRMVQKKMTDFMKEKKRTNPVLATAAKKRDFAGISVAASTSSRPEDASSLWGSSDLPPAKRVRSESVASSASSVGSCS